jgi:glycerol-3-phosphate dehydrogenase
MSSAGVEGREHAARPSLLSALEDQAADILIIGGGATGLGCAVDAASRGFRVALIEQHDFAKGTSSRSTKLIHGGVRYLRQGRVSLVLGALRERGRLCANAPHLVRPISFIIPIRAAWETAFYGAGLKLYDLLAGRLSLGATRFLSRKETLDRLPTLDPSGLCGGIEYRDAQFDDARLAIALARTARDLGAFAVNYCKAVHLLKSNGRIAGVIARDEITGAEIRIEARVVINATGVFCDALRRLDTPDAGPVVAVSQGAHIILPRRFLPGDAALLIPRTADGRVLFAIPWHGRVLVGTTDSAVDSIALEPRPLAAEIDFLLDHTARSLGVRPKRAEVLSVFSGLRPLVRSAGATSTAALSRDHTILVSDSGLVSIVGGKWTTYRQMAEETIDRAEALGGWARRPCNTANLAIHEPEIATEDSPLLHAELPYTVADVLRAVREEMAQTVEDVLARRTRALALDARAAIAIAPPVARILARELGRDESWQRATVADFSDVAGGWLLP